LCLWGFEFALFHISFLIATRNKPNNHTAEKNSAHKKTNFLTFFLLLFLSRFSEENTHFDDAMESIAGLGDSFRYERMI